jgi:hypothetical protein
VLEQLVRVLLAEQVLQSGVGIMVALAVVVLEA